MIQYYIDELISEGVTFIAPFENAHGRPRTKSASEALVSNADQTEEDGDAPTIASSAVEGAAVVPLSSRSGECIPYSHACFTLNLYAIFCIVHVLLTLQF